MRRASVGTAGYAARRLPDEPLQVAEKRLPQVARHKPHRLTYRYIPFSKTTSSCVNLALAKESGELEFCANKGCATITFGDEENQPPDTLVPTSFTVEPHAFHIRNDAKAKRSLARWIL